MKELTDEQLATEIAHHNDTSNIPVLARLELERRSRVAQHKHQIQQIELQHQLNSVLAEKQTEINKSLLKITVRATISAAILGAIVGGVVQFGIPIMYQKFTQQKSQQISRPKTEVQMSAPRSEKTVDRVPSLPPPK